MIATLHWVPRLGFLPGFVLSSLHTRNHLVPRASEEGAITDILSLQLRRMCWERLRDIPKVTKLSTNHKFSSSIPLFYILFMSQKRPMWQVDKPATYKNYIYNGNVIEIMFSGKLKTNKMKIIMYFKPTTY